MSEDSFESACPIDEVWCFRNKALWVLNKFILFILIILLNNDMLNINSYSNGGLQPSIQIKCFPMDETSKKYYFVDYQTKEHLDITCF